MFIKQYIVDRKHLDFQGVVDGLYYPFYMEWTRHAFMREALGIHIEQLFEMGHIYMVLEYQIKFRKSLRKNDKFSVSCQLEANEKKTRVNFVQKIFIGDQVYAEATFVCTCMAKGRPTIPNVILNMFDSD